MVILHIASVRNNSFVGVSVAVPQHVRAQQELADVGFVNILDEMIDGVENQFCYGNDFLISALPEPFCKPDLIIFHEVYRAEFLSLARQARKNNFHYIIIPHGTLTKEAQSKKRLKKVIANRVFFNSFINGAAAIQYLSKDEKDNSNLGREMFIGTNGVFMPNERNGVLRENNIKLLYVGNLSLRIKGLDLMLQAVQNTADTLRAKHAKLFLFGPNYKTRHTDIQRLIKEFGIGDLVELSDAIGGKKKRDELLCADIFIQTSRTEGMSMGILEALSYGLPCLVTEGTNLGDIIREYDAGWVAETNAESIAETILRALSERDRWAEKSQNAVSLIEENFQWGRVAEHTVAEYYRVLGK